MPLRNQLSICPSSGKQAQQTCKSSKSSAKFKSGWFRRAPTICDVFYVKVKAYSTLRAPVCLEVLTLCPLSFPTFFTMEISAPDFLVRLCLRNMSSSSNLYSFLQRGTSVYWLSSWTCEYRLGTVSSAYQVNVSVSAASIQHAASNFDLCLRGILYSQYGRQTIGMCYTFRMNSLVLSPLSFTHFSVSEQDAFTGLVMGDGETYITVPEFLL